MPLRPRDLRRTNDPRFGWFWRQRPYLFAVSTGRDFRDLTHPGSRAAAVGTPTPSILANVGPGLKSNRDAYWRFGGRVDFSTTPFTVAAVLQYSNVSSPATAFATDPLDTNGMWVSMGWQGTTRIQCGGTTDPVDFGFPSHVVGVPYFVCFTHPGYAGSYTPMNALYRNLITGETNYGGGNVKPSVIAGDGNLTIAGDDTAAFPGTIGMIAAIPGQLTRAQMTQWAADPWGPVRQTQRRRISYVSVPARITPATIYVSADGSDSADGLTMSTPVKTVAAALALMLVTSDKLALRYGDTYRETVTLPVGGVSGAPAEVIPWGNGSLAKPLLNGADALSGWVSTSTTPATPDSSDSFAVGDADLSNGDGAFWAGGHKTSATFVGNATDVVDTGDTYSAKLVFTAVGADARTQHVITSTPDDIYMQFRFRVDSLTSTGAVKMQGFTNNTSGSALAYPRLYYTGGDSAFTLGLDIKNSSTVITNAGSGTRYALGQFHTVEIRYKSNDASTGGAQLWVNGALEASDLTQNTAYTNSSPSRLVLGIINIVSGISAGTMHFAKVKQKNGYIGTAMTVHTVSLTKEPPQVFRGDNRMAKGPNATRLSDQTWHWDTGVLTIRDDAGNPDTVPNVIEATQRAQCITANGKSYWNVAGIAVKRWGDVLGYDTPNGNQAPPAVNGTGGCTHITLADMEANQGAGPGFVFERYEASDFITLTRCKANDLVNIVGDGPHTCSGVVMGAITTCLIDDCEMTNIGVKSYDHGYYVTAHYTGTVMHDCRATDVGGDGIKLGERSGGTGGSFYRNTLVRCARTFIYGGGAGIMLAGQDATLGAGPSKALVYNNTIVDCMWGVGIDISDDGIVAELTDFANNIIVGSVEGDLYIAPFGVGAGSSQTVTSFRNNLLNTYTGIASQTGLNGNISGDPLFTNSSMGDYSLQPGSPARGAAVAIAGITNGYSRDLGAVLRALAKIPPSLLFTRML